MWVWVCVCVFSRGFGGKKPIRIITWDCSLDVRAWLDARERKSVIFRTCALRKSGFLRTCALRKSGFLRPLSFSLLECVWRDPPVGV